MIFLTKKQEEVLKYLLLEAEKEEALIIKGAGAKIHKKFGGVGSYYVKTLEKKGFLIFRRKEKSSNRGHYWFIHQLNPEISYKIKAKETAIPSELPSNISLEEYGFWRQNQSLEEVNQNTRFLHLAFRPTLSRLKEALDYLPHLEEIRIPPSCKYSLITAKLLLRGYHINLIVGYHKKRTKPKLSKIWEK